MREQKILISPDGSQLRFLTSGDDWRLDLGVDLKIVRATHVRYDNEAGVWRVFFRLADQEGNILEIQMIPHFKTRAEAIEYEIELCEGFLEGNPTFPETILQAQLMVGCDSG